MRHELAAVMQLPIGDIFGRAILWGLLAGFCFYVVRSWYRWARGEVRLSPPLWRSAITTLGFVASTVSLIVIVTLGIHALLTGGFPYYSRPLLLSFRVGFLTALCGMLAGLIGTGPLERPTILSSLICLMIWFITGLAQ
jgi:hypothetical protein